MELIKLIPVPEARKRKSLTKPDRQKYLNALGNLAPTSQATGDQACMDRLMPTLQTPAPTHVAAKARVARYARLRGDCAGGLGWQRRRVGNGTRQRQL